MNAFILNTANAASITIAGFVSAIKGMDLTDKLAVRKATDLEALSNPQLVSIYNTATGKSLKSFSAAKNVNAERVFAALQEMDVTTLTKLDAGNVTKITAAAGERKVRDSKLQRVKAAFEKLDKDGNYRHLTIAKIMKECSKADSEVTEKIAHQYISILRAQNDRFIMNIVKDKEAGTYQYQPEAQKAAA